jgi:lipoprotein signal peptidase
VRIVSKINIATYCFIFSLDRICKIIFFNVLFRYDDVWYLKGISIIIGIVTICLLVIKTRLVRDWFWVGVVVIGGFSNLVDLILYQRVIDYLPILNYYANVSDVMICIGSLIIIYKINHGKEIRVNR